MPPRLTPKQNTGLSERDQRILDLSKTMTADQVAATLGLKTKTIHGALFNIREKLRDQANMKEMGIKWAAR